MIKLNNVVIDYIPDRKFVSVRDESTGEERVYSAKEFLVEVFDERFDMDNILEKVTELHRGFFDD